MAATNRNGRDIVEVFIEVLQFFSAHIYDIDKSVYWLRRGWGSDRWRGGCYSDEEYLAEVTVRLIVFDGEMAISVQRHGGPEWRVATKATQTEELWGILAVHFTDKDVT